MKAYCKPDPFVTETFEHALEAAVAAIKALEKFPESSITQIIDERKQLIDDVLYGATPVNNGSHLFIGKMADAGNTHIPHTGILLDVSGENEDSLKDFLTWLTNISLPVHTRVDLITEIISLFLYRKASRQRQGVGFIPHDSGEIHMVTGLWKSGFDGYLRPYENAQWRLINSEYAPPITLDDAADIATNECPLEEIPSSPLFKFHKEERPKKTKPTARVKIKRLPPKKNSNNTQRRLEAAAANVHVTTTRRTS